MENNSRLKLWLQRLSEKINEQTWFQQLKLKWDELDPQSKIYVKSGGITVTLLFIMVFTLNSMWNVHKLKQEIKEKSDLITLIESSHDEIKRLQDLSNISNSDTQNSVPWTSYLETTATTAGIEKASLTIDAEKPGPTTDLSKESLFDINLKHVNIKQVVRYIFQLESGNRPVKIRNLKIDTHSDPTGYMDSTLSISAFSLKGKEGS